MWNHTAILLLFLVFIAACHEEKVSAEGFVDVRGGKIWFKIFGSERKKTPVLLIHGGPGFPSDYLKSLQELAAERPVIFYDQLGCGRSDRPNDTSLWNIKRFAEEIAILRRKLVLDSVHLFSHSFGTMLAAEYLATDPDGIKSIVFSGPIYSTQRHLEVVNKVKLNLPSGVRDTLLAHENKGTIFSDSYINAYNEYLKLHWCRVYPYPKEIGESLSKMGAKTFETMWGYYEFYCSGNLKDFERTKVLDDIRVPTLFTCGRYDISTPEITQEYATQTKGSRVVVFEKSAHMPMNEEPELFVKVIRDFLDNNE